MKTTFLSALLSIGCNNADAFSHSKLFTFNKPMTTSSSRKSSSFLPFDSAAKTRVTKTSLQGSFLIEETSDVVGDDSAFFALDEESVGDDSAFFALDEQRLDKWVKFSVATGAVLAATSYVWFLPFGPHMGDAFLSTVQQLIGTTAPDVTILAMLLIFAIAHSGLAGLRSRAEEIVGARAWRVLFAVVSLPLSLSCISYFVHHAHEGMQLWNLTWVPGLHTACFVTDFISFLLLYPSTFNLLEVAAIEKPQLHLWETGVIRITRHPQSIGQILWCVAHSAWLGSSTAIAASSVLVAHHLFSIWHGDTRLKEKHGENFEIIKERTSVVPFQAIIEGRQKLPDDYYKEFLRGPYVLVVCGILAAYYAHPWMMAGAVLLKW